MRLTELDLGEEVRRSKHVYMQVYLSFIHSFFLLIGPHFATNLPLTFTILLSAAASRDSIRANRTADTNPRFPS